MGQGQQFCITTLVELVDSKLCVYDFNKNQILKRRMCLFPCNISTYQTYLYLEKFRFYRTKLEEIPN